MSSTPLDGFLAQALECHKFLQLCMRFVYRHVASFTYGASKAAITPDNTFSSGSRRCGGRLGRSAPSVDSVGVSVLIITFSDVDPQLRQFQNKNN